MTKQTLAQRTRANFLTGLILVLPIGITFYLVWTTVTFIDDIIVPLLPEQLTPNGVFAQNIPGFGVVFLSSANTNRCISQRLYWQTNNSTGRVACRKNTSH